EGASVDAIIAQVGGSRREIYRHFGNKAGLIDAVMQEIISEVAATVDVLAAPRARAKRAEDCRAALLDLCGRFVRMILRPEMIAAVRHMVATNGAGAEVDALWRAGPDRFQRGLSEWLEAQHALGHLVVRDTEKAAAALPSMALGSFHTQVLSGQRRSVPDDEIDAQVGYAVDLFLDAVKPARSCGPETSDACPAEPVADEIS
ncbi:MAG: TetR/AcrR family transcriptional regulator C-terminal domain-containing protein, partial [Pseudomonadota bacterium]